MEERILFTPVGEIFKNIFSGQKRVVAKRLPERAVRAASFEAAGIIKHLTGSSLVLDGKKINLSDETWVLGHLKDGAQASVKGVIRENSSFFAKKIVVKDNDA